MPELRQNLATKEWVIIATDRSKRPDDFIETNSHASIETEPPHDPNCPFCPGNEKALGPEIERWPETEPWQIKVVHNKFPALSQEGELIRTFDGVHRWLTGVGHHEVIVEHQQHNTTWALMTPEEIRRILEAFYRRGWNAREDSRMEQIIYFKNHGLRSGASLKHPLSQIIALPVVPYHIRHRIEEARRYFDDNGECVFCVMLQEELSKDERIVMSNEHFVAFVLYAALSPFHIWLLPRDHSVSFSYIQPQQLKALAQILHDLLGRLYFGLHDPGYNLIIHSSTIKEISNNYMHWYVSLVPRVSHVAGFEMGSGIFINPSLPEESAEFLRKVKIK